MARTSSSHLQVVGATALADAPGYDPEAARNAREWLDGAPTEYLLCRHGHNFAKLKRAKNGKLPKGIRTTLLPGVTGSYQVTQRCPDCGTKRVFTYTRGTDLYAASRAYTYEWPPGYRQPKGAAAYVSTADCKTAAYERDDLGTLIEESAERAAE